MKKKLGLAVNLPLPPETATLGDAEYRTWLAAAGAELAHRAACLRGSVAIRACCAITETPRDLEKIAGRLIDVLVAHNVIAEGSVADLNLRFDRTITPGRVRIECKEVKAPASRLCASARANVAQVARARWDEFRAKAA